MYAIPAETATQGEPFQKENLPGPGKCAILLEMCSQIDHWLEEFDGYQG